MGSHHGHSHASDQDQRRLILTFALVATYMVAEVIGGWLSGSLALLADAGHMLSDAGALLVALFALRIGRRPASASHTFGYRRAEVLAAVANGAALIAIAAYVVYAAVQRLGDATPIHAPLMLAVAAGGLGINLLGLWLLHGGESDNLNLRGAWLHVLSDALGSVGAMIAGVLVWVFGWTWADPVASLLIAILVVYAAWRLLGQAVAVLMQAVPAHLDLGAIEHTLAGIDGVLEVHDLHVWSVTSGRDVISAHLSVDPAADRPRIAGLVQQHLREDFALHHSTIQLDCPGGCLPCSPAGR